MSQLILADHQNGKLSNSTAHVVAAAQQLAEHGAGEIDILVTGDQVESVAEAASKLSGVSRVLIAEHPVYAHQLAEPLANLLAALVDDYSHVLTSSSTTAKNVIPRLAALQDVSPITDVLSIESDDIFKRPIYAGNAISTVQSLDRLKLLTVRSTSFDPVGTSDNSIEIEVLDIIADNKLSSFVSEEISQNERPELGGARVVISGGRGMGNGENFKLLEAIADKLGAAIGASRAAVDAGYVPSNMQVGQTGKIVAPELYIAVGISGAIQHLAGMKDSKVIVAINKDEEAPIFQVSDYWIVGDLFDVLPEISEKL